jgi:DNA gyrase subunit A
MTEAIEDVGLDEATRKRYLNYAMSVITSRALPDVRDGLKPVQRRILYAMYHNLSLTPDAKHRKSAAVVGEVMAKYHPHGDQSIYDAMVRMAQEFSLRYPLVDGQGNFGSLDGDGAAAMRYTEAKLRHVAVELLSELKKRTVDYRQNYDGTLFEPVVLPAQLPNLLINGASGIAVGMATQIPPHNVAEVVGALIAMIDTPALTLEEVVAQHILAPDFPTGGEILNTPEELIEIYRTGSGAVELRGTWKLDEETRRSAIVLTSIPYGLNKADLISDIADHVRQGRLPQLVDVRDESTEEIRIVLEMKKGANADAVMAYLYRRTALQSRFNVNLTVLCPTDDPDITRPARIGLMDVLEHFLQFRYQVTRRRLEFDLQELERRIHLLRGFEIIFNALDEAIALIRASDGKAHAREGLMERFGLDEEQAEAILETRLYKLARLEIEAIRRELAEKLEMAERIRATLDSEPKMWELIRSELVHLRDAYGDRRRTAVRGPVEQIVFSEETYIVAEDAFVFVTRAGWIKRQKSYTDLTAVRVKEGDEVGWAIPASSREALVLFTSVGRAYTLRVADIPTTSGYGEPVQARFQFVDGERVVGAVTTDARSLPPVRADVVSLLPEGTAGPPWVVAITRAGRGLRLPLALFAEPSTVNGRVYARLADETDAITQVFPCDGSEFVSMVSRLGRAIIFPVSDLNLLSGPGKGVLALKLVRDDFVLAFKLVRDRMDGLTVETNRGRTEVIRPNKFTPVTRGGRGRELLRMGYIARVEVEVTEISWEKMAERAEEAARIRPIERPPRAVPEDDAPPKDQGRLFDEN